MRGGRKAGSTPIMRRPYIAASALIRQVHSGRLKHFYQCWLLVTSNPIILCWIRKGISIHQPAIPRTLWSPKERRQFVAGT